MEPIRITIRFKAGFAVQSGYGLAGILDNTVMRDARGLPYIPGTTLKGVIREACTEISLLKREPYKNVIDEMNNIIKQDKDPNIASSYSPVTRIFGTPFIPSAFEFHSAYIGMEETDRDVLEFVRDWASWNESHTSISPETGTAKKGHLFSMEVTAHDFHCRDYLFCFDIVPVPGLVNHELFSLIFCGIRLVDHIGSGKTRGKGLVEMDISMPYSGRGLEEWISIIFNHNGSKL